jgi:hypothetical protein
MPAPCCPRTAGGLRLDDSRACGLPRARLVCMWRTRTPASLDCPLRNWTQGDWTASCARARLESSSGSATYLVTFSVLRCARSLIHCGRRTLPTTANGRSGRGEQPRATVTCARRWLGPRRRGPGTDRPRTHAGRGGSRGRCPARCGGTHSRRTARGSQRDQTRKTFMTYSLLRRKERRQAGERNTVGARPIGDAVVVMEPWRAVDLDHGASASTQRTTGVGGDDIDPGKPQARRAARPLDSRQRDRLRVDR